MPISEIKIRNLYLIRNELLKISFEILFNFIKRPFTQLFCQITANPKNEYIFAICNALRHYPTRYVSTVTAYEAKGTTRLWPKWFGKCHKQLLI